MRIRRGVCFAGAVALAWFGEGTARGQAADHARLVVQLGHSNRMSSVAFSSDGRYVVTGNEDNTAVLWEADTGRELRQFQGHSRAVTGAAFSPDGRYVLTGSVDGTAKLWDAATGKLARTFDNHSAAILSVAFSPTGESIATGDEHGAVILWNVSDGHEERRLAGHSKAVRSVTFSSDGRYVLTGSDDKSARLWDVRTGQQVHQFDGHTDTVYSARLSPDGRTVLTGSRDATARLWNTATGKETLRLDAKAGVVFAVAFSPRGDTVLTGNEDRSTRLFDAASGHELRRFIGHSNLVRSVAFSPDGRSLLTGSWDGTVNLWDAAGGNEVRRFEGAANYVTSIAVSTMGHLVSTGSWDHTATVWDIATGQNPQRFEGHTGGVFSVTFSHDDKFLLTGSDDNTAKLWDVASAMELRHFDGHMASVLSVAFAPDDRSVLTGSHDGTARLWDRATAKQLQEFRGHTGRVYTGDRGDGVTAVAFSPDGQRFFSGSDDTITRVWDLKTGTVTRQFDDHHGYISSLTLSGDGSKVLTGSQDETALLQDSNRGRFLQEFRLSDVPGIGFNYVNAVALSPDGKYALTGSEDKVARLWDVASGQEIRQFQPHAGRVTAVAFAADGRLVLTASVDGTTRVLDTNTGKELASLFSFSNGGWAVVDPEGRFDTNDLDGGAPLQWVVDDDPMRTLPLEIFMRDYYTPGLLTRLLKGENLPPVKSIAEIKNRVQPDVRVMSVTPSAAMQGRVDVVVHAASHVDAKQASGLQDLRLFRDGQMVPGGYLAGPLKDDNYTFRDVQLKTQAAKVMFTAYAFSSERIKSSTAAKEYEPKQGLAKSTARPHAYLLQIGVNHYAATGCDLRFSVNDAETMSAVLKKRLEARGMVVEAVVLESVAGSDATGASRERIHAALAKIAAKATPDDAFFLSFSGHGVNSGGQFYIMPSNIEGSCEHPRAELLKNAISADALAEWLRPIDAGEMALVLDACRSASSVESEGFKAGPLGSRGLGQLAYDKRMRILAASQSNEAAGEYEPLHQGLLSYVLTQNGLEESKADWKPVDQRITVGEWLAYAAGAVPKFDPTETPAAAQNPKTPQEAPLQTPALFNFSKRDTFVLQ